MIAAPLSQELSLVILGYTQMCKLTHMPTHALSLRNAHTSRRRLHSHGTHGCIIDKLLITPVAISADLSREHPGSL